MRRLPSPPQALTILALTALTALTTTIAASCTATLEEGCADGECVLSGSPPVPEPWPESDAGDAATCMDTTDVGDMPCDIFMLIQTHCQTCHTMPTQNGAPFPLLTYEDTQEPFGMAGQQRWQRMAEVITTGFMPIGKTLPEADKQALLNWLNNCATPIAEGMGCE